MAFVKVEPCSFLLVLFLYISSSHAFMQNLNGKKQQLVNNEIRPDLNDIVDLVQQDNTQLNIQLHVGDEESGFLTVQDMIIQLGGRYNENEEERVKLPGNNGRNSKCTSGGVHALLSGQRGLSFLLCDIT